MESTAEQLHTTELPVKAKCFTPKIPYGLLRGDRLVGLALAMSNGTWRAYTSGVVERALSPSLKSPQAVADWAQRIGLGVSNDAAT